MDWKANGARAYEIRFCKNGRGRGGGTYDSGGGWGAVIGDGFGRRGLRGEWGAEGAGEGRGGSGEKSRMANGRADPRVIMFGLFSHPGNTL